MRTLPLVAAVAAAACLVAPAAEAKHRKPLSGSYDLVLPVPFPGESESGSHCEDAPEGLSKDTRKLTLPSSGRLKLAVSEYSGDWVVEVYDPKGRMVGFAAGLTLDGEPSTLTVKKKTTKSEKYTVAVCNYTGGPEGHVAWTFTFDR